MSGSISIFNHSRIPVFDETDVLVIGGGSAGCLAALAARLNGKYKVSLIERYGFLGGTSTQMLDTFYGFFTPGDTPRKIVGGLPDSVVDELDSTGDIFLRPNTYGAGTGVNYNPERLKFLWDRMLANEGIFIHLHTSLVDVVVLEGTTHCVVWHKSGFFIIKAKRVIDASGDADFCHLSGMEYEVAGDKEPAQSMTTTFRMCNVNQEKYEQGGGKKMLQEKMKDALKHATHPLPRAEGSVHEMCQPGCVSTVAVKVTDRSALNIKELSDAEMEGRRQAFIYEDFFRKEVPGYENSKIIGLSNQIGVRETRRVYGEYRLTKEDCMAGTIPASSIFLCGAPIEDHRKGTNGNDETFLAIHSRHRYLWSVLIIPLFLKKSSRTWVVGRCFSATHDAHASCRSMAQTMSMGQAAGIAATLSLKNDTDAVEVNISQLQKLLLEAGAILEIPKHTADITREGWNKNRNG